MITFQERLDDLVRRNQSDVRGESCCANLNDALTLARDLLAAVPVCESNEVLVAITRPEGYDDTCPELVAEDAINAPFAYRVVQSSPPVPTGEKGK